MYCKILTVVINVITLEQPNKVRIRIIVYVFLFSILHYQNKTKPTVLKG